ncbi:MAG: barstar family protein [Ruminococcus sp.]
MKNEILKITEVEFEEIKSKVDFDKTFLAEVDGSSIPDEKSFFDYMERLYDLHTINGIWGRNWDALNDLMRDLLWIVQQNHILAIHSYNKMFLKNKALKKVFIQCMSECILPFWEEEVLYTVVGGETKEFIVYLID